MALALGTWLVCRDHGAERWAAAVVSVALPVSGYTLYWDAGSWAAGLLAFAYAPWVWWSFRRVLQGAAEPVLGLPGRAAWRSPRATPTAPSRWSASALALSSRAGRPQLGRRGAPSCCSGSRRRVAAAGLPAAAGDGRAGASGPAATCSRTTARCARPSATCSSLGSPTYVPPIRAITGPDEVPAVYFAWFLLPLLPWLRYGVLRGRARELVGVATLAAFYCVLAIGPSQAVAVPLADPASSSTSTSRWPWCSRCCSAPAWPATTCAPGWPAPPSWSGHRLADLVARTRSGRRSRSAARWPWSC